MPETPGGSSAESDTEIDHVGHHGRARVGDDDDHETVRQLELAHAIGRIGLSRCEALGDQHEPKDEVGEAFAWCPH